MRPAAGLRTSHPAVGVLVLSQVVEATHALALVGERPAGVGYLLKDRVLDVEDFLEGCRARLHVADRQSTPRSSPRTSSRWRQGGGRLDELSAARARGARRL